MKTAELRKASGRKHRQTFIMIIHGKNIALQDGRIIRDEVSC